MGLDSVELVLKTEDTFNIAITDKEAEACYTVGALYELVLSKLDKDHDKTEVWKKLCDVITYILGVPAEKIAPEAHFIDDLGLD